MRTEWQKDWEYNRFATEKSIKVGGALVGFCYYRIHSTIYGNCFSSTGYFEFNMRHGKGACSYRDGSRYVGSWYRSGCIHSILNTFFLSSYWSWYVANFLRGTPEGFGIFISSIGEKYVGEWAANKKHGVGMSDLVVLQYSLC